MAHDGLWRVESVPAESAATVYGIGVTPRPWTFIFGLERITEARLRDVIGDPFRDDHGED